MSHTLSIPIPKELLAVVEDLVRRAVADALSGLSVPSEGFLDVKGAAGYLASTPHAVRSLVKREAIPYHKAPNGRLLFDRTS